MCGLTICLLLTRERLWLNRVVDAELAVDIALLALAFLADRWAATPLTRVAWQLSGMWY